MAMQSRRKAREVALRALYESEIGKTSAGGALKQTLEETQLDSELAAYATVLVNGVREHLADIDDRLAKLIREYAFERVAAVDRNVMRIAAYELFYEPAVPPAVTLNEAVEVAKKYSTAESGKFVNGVLGQLLKESPKANWNPANAPGEPEQPGGHEPPMEIEEVEVELEQAKKLAKVGGWTLRSEDPE
jgi:transcription antitermination factor NusB